MSNILFTHNLGYPRIGERRELKRATESFWNGSLTVEGLEQVGAEIRRANWLTQRNAGIDLIPSNDFSFYDQMLDMRLRGRIIRSLKRFSGHHILLVAKFFRHWTRQEV